MNLRKSEWAITIFTVLYLLIFSFYYISIKNYEFMLYIGVVVFFAILIGSTLRKTNFDSLVLWGLSIWGLLHMAGGSLRVGDGVLYKLVLIPLVNISPEFTILKFDQFVHFLGFGVATIAMFQLMLPHLKEKIPTKAIYFSAFLAGMGLGALNEIVEFIAVVVAPETGVGGYFNSSLDLVFNALGALAGIFIAYIRNK
jgi:hypothetical protein